MARPIVAVVDLAAIAANVARVRELAPGAEMFAVVKANAYGHGLLRVLPSLAAADGLALVELEAALLLREAGYARRILLLEGFFEARELVPIADAALGIVVHDAARAGRGAVSDVEVLELQERGHRFLPRAWLMRLAASTTTTTTSPGSTVSHHEVAT